MERKKILTEWRCRKWAAAMLAAMLSLTATAQNDEVGFSADRPGATTGTDVVEKGRLQWETGVGYERSRLEETASESPSGVLRAVALRKFTCGTRKLLPRENSISRAKSFQGMSFWIVSRIQWWYT